MLNKKNDVDDSSRNGSNAANPPMREIVNLITATEGYSCGNSQTDDYLSKNTSILTLITK